MPNGPLSCARRCDLAVAERGNRFGTGLASVVASSGGIVETERAMSGDRTAGIMDVLVMDTLRTAAVALQRLG